MLSVIFVSPYFDHDASIHHTMHIPDAPVSWSALISLNTGFVQLPGVLVAFQNVWPCPTLHAWLASVAFCFLPHWIYERDLSLVVPVRDRPSLHAAGLLFLLRFDHLLESSFCCSRWTCFSLCTHFNETVPLQWLGLPHGVTFLQTWVLFYLEIAYIDLVDAHSLWLLVKFLC